MRKLMWFTVGFAAACGAGIYLLFGQWHLLIGLFCLLGSVALLFLKTKPAKITAVVLLGCATGFVWIWGYEMLYLSPAKGYDGEAVSLTVTASDYSYQTNYGQAFDGTIQLEGIPYRVRCYLKQDRTIVPGNVVQGTFHLRYTADGGQKEPTYHQGKGIFLLAYQKGEAVVTAGELRLRDYPARWRHQIMDTIELVFPDDTAGFAKALLLGDSTDLTYRQNRDFQVSGIRHVIAVSGLHVSILFALIYLTFGRQRVLNTVFGIPLLIVFAAIAGFTPSIVRACVMQCLILLALLTNKEYDPPTALAFAALLLLGINPRTITSVSFQLSVSCIIGIFAFHERLQEYLLSFGKLKENSKGKSLKAKGIRWCTGTVSVTLSTMTATTPLCAAHFGMVSLVGILSNLLVLWVVSLIFYGIMAACLVSAVWLPLGRGIGWLVSWPIRYVLTVSGWLADFPLAAVYTDSVYIVFWLIFAYVLLGTFFLLKRKQPAVTALGILAGLLVCIALSWLEPTLDDTRVTVIDVGQGQSILIQQGSQHYLVDCGGKNSGETADRVTNCLLSQGIFRLDAMILTHYDADHGGGVVNLLENVNVDRIYMPDTYDSNGIRQKIENTASEKIRLITESTPIDVSDGKIKLYPAKPGVNDNESSVCVLFQTEKCDILITGDRSSTGERALLNAVQLPELELLIVGHHGSSYATSEDLLLATRPKAAVISVGADNPYGHPHSDVLERLSRYGCRIYRTDLQGTIIFRG